MSILNRRAQPGPVERVEALGEAIDFGEGILDPDALEGARRVVDRADARLRHGTAWTVAALAGATGSGKSSLFNAFAGAELSTTGVRRPTTGVAHACVWGSDDPGTLLDWLDVPRRHRQGAARPDFDGLVLVDLPDHDSVVAAHRIEMERLAEVVDLIVWVVDPEKYADAALHRGYLRPLAGHGPVMAVALNKVDRLTDAGRRSCVEDLRRLLAADGLPEIPLVEVSATTGEGLADLERLVAGRVVERRAALDRLELDTIAAAEWLLREAGGGDGRRELARSVRNRAIEALTDAAGASVVADAIAAGYRRDAHEHVGWPLTRWVRRVRPHPLRRLHLGRGTAGRMSLPPPNPIQRAAATIALRDLADAATQDLGGPWPAQARAAVLADPDGLADRLDTAVRRAAVADEQPPRWWRLAGWLQWALMLAAIAGAVWLATLFSFAYLRLPDPPTPEIGGRLPVPTAMLLGGVGAGLAFAALGRRLARAGGRRRARRATRRIEAAVTAVVDDAVLAPLDAALGRRDDLLARLTVAAAPHRR